MKVPVCVGVTVSVPLMALLPLQSPLAVQGAFEFHVIVALSPRVIESGSTEMVRVAGGLEPPPPP